MDIKFTVFATGATIINNYLIYLAAETSAPATVVKTAVDPPPQTFPRPVFLANVQPVPHIVKVYSSVDGVGLDLLLSEFMYDPSFTNVEVRPSIYLVVSRGEPYDPVEGDTFIGPIDGSNPDPSLADISTWDWKVKLRSLGGELRPDEYVVNGSNDGFTYPPGFYGAGTETIIISFEPKISTVTPIFVSQNVFNGYKRITASDTVAVDWYNKYVDLVFDADTGFIELQALSAVAENAQLTMFNMNGNQEQLTIRAAAGESIRWMNRDMTELYIGKNEDIWLYKRTDTSVEPNVPYWHVARDLPGMVRVGSRFKSDTGIRQPSVIPNAAPFNGQPLPIAKWPRINWYANQFPVGMLIPIADRTEALKGKWAFDALNIYPPDLRGYHDRNIPGDRNNDSGRTAASETGSYDGSHLMSHTHPVQVSVLRPNPDGGGIPDYVGVETGATGVAGDRTENTVLTVGVAPMFWL